MEAQTRCDVLRRLRSIEGHVGGVARMVEDQRDCVAILQQLRALQGALKQASLLLLSHHLDDCLCELWSSANDTTRQQVRSEILAIIEHP